MAGGRACTGGCCCRGLHQPLRPALPDHRARGACHPHLPAPGHQAAALQSTLRVWRRRRGRRRRRRGSRRRRRGADGDVTRRTKPNCMQNLIVMCSGCILACRQLHLHLVSYCWQPWVAAENNSGVGSGWGGQRGVEMAAIKRCGHLAGSLPMPWSSSGPFMRSTQRRRCNARQGGAATGVRGPAAGRWPRAATPVDNLPWEAVGGARAILRPLRGSLTPAGRES